MRTAKAAVTVNEREGDIHAGAAPPSARRRAATPYVSGFTTIAARSHEGAPSTGKNAPERSHIGIRKRFMIAWNPWVDSSDHAIANPRAVSAKARTASSVAAA